MIDTTYWISFAIYFVHNLAKTASSLHHGSLSLKSSFASLAGRAIVGGLVLPAFANTLVTTTCARSRS